MTIVTMPLGLTRARMFRPVPVLTFEIVLKASELPPLVTPGLTLCELSVGTESPTVIDAGMLSVAMIFGEERTFVRDLCCCKKKQTKKRQNKPTRKPTKRKSDGVPL